MRRFCILLKMLMMMTSFAVFGQNGDLDLIAVEAGKLFMLFQT
jgi:hypothetical protein